MNELQQSQYNKIKNLTESEGWKILSERYINCETKMDLLCSNNHLRNITYKDFMSGNRCSLCSKEKIKIEIRKEKSSNFINKIEELGGKVIGEYINIDTRVECICKEGHKCDILPSTLNSTKKITCGICLNRNTKDMNKEIFIKKIEDLGGKVIGEYINIDTKVNCECKEGHQFYLNPYYINNNIINYFCKICENKNPKVIFFEKIKELEAKIVGEYINCYTKIECICKQGHTCFVIPSKINSGNGLCVKCTDRCPEKSENKFKKIIEEMGGKVIGEYTYSHNKVECVCKNGHQCFPVPADTNGGHGICKKCVNRCPEEAKIKFYKKIEEMGGKIMGEYVNTSTKIKCICKNGHECNIKPNTLLTNYGMCSKCSGQCPEEAFAKFNKWIENLGGKVIGEYKDSKERIECICNNGHKCFLLPASKNYSHIPCILCKNTTENVIFNELNKNFNVKNRVKFNWCINTETDRLLEYDLIINDIIIIEIDGEHHFSKVKAWYSEPENILKRDIFKMKKAMENEYFIVRINQIDVYNNKFDWKKELIEEINKIISIKKCPIKIPPYVCYIEGTKKGIYDKHKEFMFNKELIL
jgi:hypothetical protein